MKYQTISISTPSGTPVEPQIAGITDRLFGPTNWAAWDEFKVNAVGNGGLDRFWGDLDSITDEPNGLKKTTVTFNTLDAAEGFFSLLVDPTTNNPKAPTILYSSKLVEIQDDGTIVSTIKESNDVTPN